MIDRIKDRRRFTWKTVVGSITDGRRLNPSRSDDIKNGYYTDKIEKSAVLGSVLFLVLSVLDIVFTLHILGGDTTNELNPIMRYLLDINPIAFVITKISLVGACMFFLYWHRHFSLLGLIRAKNIITCLNVIYVALVLYEISILTTYFF